VLRTLANLGTILASAPRRPRIGRPPPTQAQPTQEGQIIKDAVEFLSEIYARGLADAATRSAHDSRLNEERQEVAAEIDERFGPEGDVFAWKVFVERDIPEAGSVVVDSFLVFSRVDEFPGILTEPLPASDGFDIIGPIPVRYGGRLRIPPASPP